MTALFIVLPLFGVAVVLFAINFLSKLKNVGEHPSFFSHSGASERENYFISIHHKKKELQNDPAMLSEIKILIEKSFSLLQVNEGLI